jgi:hypothetical protein
MTCLLAPVTFIGLKNNCGMNCCKGPVAADATPKKPSIYGTDLSKAEARE